MEGQQRFSSRGGAVGVMGWLLGSAVRASRSLLLGVTGLLGVSFWSSCSAPGIGWEARLEEARSHTPEVEEEVLPFGLWLPVRARGDLIAPLRVAYALSLGGDAEGAFALVSRLDAEHPRTPALLAARAALQRMMGFQRAAEADLSEALELAPEETELALGLAELRLDLSLPSGAVAALGRARAAGRDDAEVHRMLGRAFANLGRPRDARRHVDLAVERAPADELELLLEGATLQMTYTCRSRAGDGAEAWIDATLERALDLAPDRARVWHLLGLQHSERGRVAASVAAFEEACRLEPWNREAWTHLALASHEARDQERLDAALGQALALENDRWRARRLRGLQVLAQPLVADGR